MVDLQNPYAPPSAQRGQPARVRMAYDLRLVDASLSQRFLHWIVDEVLIAILGFGLGGSHGDIAARSLVVGSSALLAKPLYYVLFEAALGRTPGKFLTGTRVVTLAGDRVGFGRVLWRIVVRYIPFDPLSFLIRQTHDGWHDRWSKTRVVLARARRSVD
jgi:uncharacterized RDD family membrane protein YckC